MKDAMGLFVKLAGVCGLLALPGGAATEIRAILNAASYARPGMPNSGIARGSMFVVFGTELGPATLLQASGYPLPTSLGGTSIRVTVGTTTVNALLVYAWATQVAAILPSGTPEGIGLMEVTYNGHTGQAGAFRVVRSSPGVLTQNQAGIGQALAQNFVSPADQPRNTLSRPAAPGQVVTLWATGLGPITESDAAIPVPRDLNLNLQVLVGGKAATVRYKGRSGCCAGVDQITFEVPAGVRGCFAPVVVQVDNVVSNITTLSVAGPGESACTDLSGITGPMLENLQSGGTLRVGTVVLGVIQYGIVSESGLGLFFRANLNWLAGQISIGLPSAGSCLVNPPNITLGVPYAELVALDAGRVLNVTSPKGSRQMLQRYPGGYSETFANGTQVQFLEPGTFTVETATGGVDVGPFRTTISVPAELTTTLPRPGAATTVTWRGGDPTGHVVIQGAAQSTTGLPSSFTCVERTSAGQFSLPGYLLASLPGSPSNVSAWVAAGTAPQNRFQAQGLDLGYFNFCSPISPLCGGWLYDYFEF